MTKYKYNQDINSCTSTARPTRHRAATDRARRSLPAAIAQIHVIGADAIDTTTHHHSSPRPTAPRTSPAELVLRVRAANERMQVGEPALLAELRARRGDVTCAAACAARLAAGGGDGVLRLWRWQRGLGWLELDERKLAHRYGVTGARFCGSGLLLATAGVDGAARVWAVRDALTERRTLAAPMAAPARCVLWATGERLAVGHDDGALRVWALGGALLLHVRAHEGALHALAAPASAALLLSACTEGVLKVFDFEDLLAHGAEGAAGPAPLFWEDGAHDLGALCAAEHGDAAATGGHDGAVRVWLTARGRIAAGGTLAGHTAAVTALHWSRHVLASASLDRTARLWSPFAGACLHVLRAHTRYLTCVALAEDLRYLVTGSNDRSIRTWSLGSFSIQDDLEAACSPLAHFGVGDLEGIGPVADEEAPDAGGAGASGAGAGAMCVARAAHGAAINCIAASGERVATACSDGGVRVFALRAAAGEAQLVLERQLAAHAYPALAVDFGAGGALLLSAGLDGCARLWDVEAGCSLSALSAEGLGGGGGGGGVRDARVSSQRPPLLLLASDDGLAAVWGIDPPTPEPMHVYSELGEAVTCCAWTGDGRALAAGSDAGGLRLLRAPPAPSELAHRADAHDLGMLSCDFSPKQYEDDVFLLATGGRDARVRLWWAAAEGGRGALRAAGALWAHEGAVQCVRWGADGALATGGTDRWARVWRVEERVGGVEAHPLAAVPADAGGAPAVRLLEDHRLAVGSLSGALSVWRLPACGAPEETEGAEARGWSVAGVARWLREYVTRPPGSTVSEAAEARLLQAACNTALSGARLLDEPLAELLVALGHGSDDDETVDENETNEIVERLRDELLWLRRAAPAPELEALLPHALRCPLSHGALREPARAADGYTYERQNFLHWLVAAGGEDLRSPMSGRRLRSTRVEPNYGARAQLRHYLGWPPGRTADAD